MSFALVTPDGKYHGHVKDEAAARELENGRKEGAKLLTEAEWATITPAMNQSQRVEAFSKMGKAI